ncbi:MAG: NAD/NADP octopine/nopaline dehydrogenase family protein [Anaerolineales bacterium]|nr:NAD/NADP octopine/nopaline dehydrogenase family protein [Anaerolineales bacterium]
MRITICGGGNAAHTAAGLFAARQEHQVNVYLSFEVEAQRWREGVETRGGIVVNRAAGSLLGRPERIGADPAEVIPGAGLVLLALPAFAHEAVIGQVAPYLEDGAWLGALAARGCFDLAAQEMLGDRAGDVALFGLQTLPWACRIREYGQEVDVLGTKARVDIAVQPERRADELADLLGEGMGLTLERISNFLALTIAGTGQLIHPGVMYGRLRGWDGSPFEQAPLFYQGIDVETAGVLQRMSDEVQALRAELSRRYPALDLGAVRPLDEWLFRSYASDIEDRSSLQASFVTNRSYAGLKVPVRATEGGLSPDFQARYLSEDVPYALLATRGIAELAAVPTPTIDEVICWAQERLGAQYLVGGELRGRDVRFSRAPQRFGFHSLEAMIEAMFSFA